MRAVHAVLEQLPKTLNPVGRELGSGLMIGPSPFLAAMVDGTVNVAIPL